MAIDAMLEARLREMGDRDEIWQVIVRYCRGMDRLDVDLLRSCYFEDAVDDHGRFVGLAEDFIQWATKATAFFPMMQHAAFNHVCELDGDDAHAETSYICSNINAQSPHLLTLGRYLDHFQRRNGEWRIANRVALVERSLEISDNLAIPPLPSPHPVSRDRNDISYQRPVRPRRPDAETA